MIFVIIILTAIISIMAFQNRLLFDRLRFSPYAIKHDREGWRFLTYAFLHANWGHLLINMFVFYSFGEVVVSAFRQYFELKGVVYFLLLYFGGILFSVLFDFGRNKDNPTYSAVGASGAVAAVVFSSILIYPAGSIFLFPIPFPIPSIFFGVIYLVYSAVMARRGKDNIGHNAHFWGAVFGIIFTLALKPALFLSFLEQLQGFFN